jgi:hypothetical protein
MKAKDLLPNTIYEVTRISSHGERPYPGTEFVVTTDDVTPSNIDWDGRECMRSIYNPNFNDDWWVKEVPVRKYVSVHAVRWTGARPQPACHFIHPDGTPIDEDHNGLRRRHPDAVLAWYTEYEPGPDDHFFMEEGTSQMELRHIDGTHLNGEDDETLHDAEGRGIIFGYEGEPHQVVRTLEQLTENHLHRYAARVVRDNADAEEQRTFEASNKARWEAIDADTLELLDLTARVKNEYGNYSGRRTHGAYVPDEDRVEVWLSLDQIEAINALVKEAEKDG